MVMYSSFMPQCDIVASMKSGGKTTKSVFGILLSALSQL